MRVLVCAATQAEAKACSLGIKDAGLSRHFEVLKTGVGLKKALASLEKRLGSWTNQHSEHKKPSLIISSGFAGSADGLLSIGAWICAREMNGNWNGIFEKLECIPCGIISVEKIGSLPDDHKLQKPIAIDMESKALARVSKEHGIDFQVLRLITDTPNAPLPQVVSHWARFLASDRFLDQITFGCQLVKYSILAPKSTLRLVQNSLQWLSLLRLGWKSHARAIHDMTEIQSAWKSL